MSTRLEYVVTVFAFIGVALVISVHAGTEGTRRIDFDHAMTGFPLTGAHRSVRCETCHVNGLLHGTPRECAMCHMAGSMFSSSYMPVQHIPTTSPCTICHRTVSWTPAFFRHQGVAPGTCTSCHNGVTASGKPSKHVVTTASCDSCHRTSAWTPAGFSHANVAPGTCINCHNGSTATGKSANHIATSAPCDSCHRTTALLPTSARRWIHPH